jgi:hypothetical protein
MFNWLLFIYHPIQGRKSLELFLSQKNRYLKIPSQQLQSLYYEASSGTLAMEGLGLFKITSGFLGSVSQVKGFLTHLLTGKHFVHHFLSLWA